MRKLILAAFLVAMPFVASADDELPGTYRLISSTRKILDTGEEVKDTYGKHPSGSVMYGKDGRFLVLVVYDERPKPESIDKTTDQQRADLFRSMLAYGGTYKFDGKSIKHEIDMSWNEAWTGTTVIRDVTRDGDKLIYTTRPAPFSGDGKMSVVTVGPYTEGLPTAHTVIVGATIE